MKSRIKEYWDLNKKMYCIFFILQILIGIFYVLIQSNPEISNLMYAEEVVNLDSATANTIYWLLFLSFGLGVLTLAITLVQIYIIIRPFITKQLQQTLTLGNSVTKYVDVHLIAIIAMCFLELFVVYTTNLTSHVINQQIQGLGMIKNIASNISFPLWIVTIPLLLMNGNVLTDLMPRKRMAMIIAGVLLLWFSMSLLYLFPNINSLLFSGIKVMNEETTIITETRVKILDLFVDLTGIFVFLLAYNSFKNKFEVIV